MTGFPIFILFAGLSGAAGVVLSAAAAHLGGGVGAAATMLLVHAPAFLALGLLGAPRATRIGGWILFVGVVIFTADLLSRAYAGGRLLPMGAPLGGVLMIGGWLAVAVSAFLGRRS